MNELKNDNNLRQAVSRREQQLPPMPADLNKRLMQRIAESEPARPETKSRRLWIYAAVAVAASIALLIIFNFGQEQTPQESLVALRVGQPTTSVPEPVEGEPVIEEPSNAASESVEAPAPQPSQKPAKKRQETVMKLVELIPTPEVEPALTAEAEPTLEAAANAEEDPLVAMAAQLEDIRSRGQRLQQEITAIMNN
jgi:cytoskeletal protein RodZ